MNEEEKTSEETHLAIVQQPEDVKVEKSSIKKELEAGFKDVFIENIIPKLKKHLKPAVDHLMEYLGEDEKVLIMRNTKEGGKLFVLEASKSEILIEEDAVINTFDIHESIELIIQGKLSEYIEKKIDDKINNHEV